MARTRDIEEVLSAVRRLVAGDGQADGRAPGEPTLLLSAAQRVDGPDDWNPEMPADPPEDGDGVEQTPEHARERGKRNAASGTARSRDTPAGETDHLDEPFDIWARAMEELDLPRDYAEDADFEEAERSGADDRHRPPTTMARTSAPSRLSDLSTGLVDEDQLRDLIADVVRQELSGELGERITRNVRKLVRREIRQILASEDLDRPEPGGR